jgi:N-carbamoyl-L-amino-acid hydrolase
MVSASQYDTSMNTVDLRINGKRLLADFEALAQIGGTSSGGVSRPALSLEDLEARAWFADRIEEAGFFVRDDDAGNLSGVMPSDNPDAQTLLIGSHLDTVPNGGRYDGAIGVLAGLEVMRTIQEAGQRLPVHLEVMNFTDEEGTWFSLLGSRGLTGRLPVGKLGDRRGEDGTFRAALARAGIDIDRIKLAKRDPSTLAGFLELHIEQGKTLEELQAQIGIARAIVGRTTYRMTFRGESGHSGTTDIHQRRDALQGAALFITEAHTLAQDRFDGSVVNCGSLEVSPGAFNVIPNRATLLVECRHADEDTLLELENNLLELAQDCATTHGLQLEATRLEHMDAATMDAGFIAAIERVCNRMSLRHTSLISYAGHDAQPLSAITTSAMIFIPLASGVSHTPLEAARWDDVETGANVLLQTALEIAQKTNHS